MSDSKFNVMIHQEDMLYDFHLRVGDGDAPLEVNFVLGPRWVGGCPVRLHWFEGGLCQFLIRFQYYLETRGVDKGMSCTEFAF